MADVVEPLQLEAVVDRVIPNVEVQHRVGRAGAERWRPGGHDSQRRNGTERRGRHVASLSPTCYTVARLLGDARRMFRHRLTLTGPDDSLIAAGAELVAMGATPVSAGCFIASLDGGAETWREFAAMHPSMRVSVDVFDEFEEEFVQAIVTANGTLTVSHRNVLPEKYGCFDEGGEPIPKPFLTAAGRTIAADRLLHDVGTLSSPLDDALTMGKSLGRFCSRVEQTVFDDPRRSELDAVREVAVFAWWIAVADQAAGTPAELEFDHALVLTQAVVQAGREELWDRPGRACWMSWAQTIIGGASDVIEAGTAGESAPEGHLGFAARSLLTTCIQTLALFDESLSCGSAR
jgi:hypothetical protein